MKRDQCHERNRYEEGADVDDARRFGSRRSADDDGSV